MNIATAGTDYVSLSSAVLLAQHNKVIAEGIVQVKVDNINAVRSSIDDAENERYVTEKLLSLTANMDKLSVYVKAYFVINATFTDCNPDKMIFLPEFLIDGNALYDNLYLLNIIVGEKCGEQSNACCTSVISWICPIGSAGKGVH